MSHTDAGAAATALVACVAACGSGGRSPKLALRYHPPAGATYRFLLEQRQHMEVEGARNAQQLVIRMHFTQSVAGAPAARPGTQVRIIFDSVAMDVPGMSPARLARELDRLRGLEATVLFDERAQVISTDFTPSPGIPPEMAAQMAAGVKLMTFAFPEAPVGRGDAWIVTTELPLNQLPGTTTSEGVARTTLTIRRIDIAQAPIPDTTVLLDVRTAFPDEPIRLEIGGREATLLLSGTLTGEQTFSMTRGAIVAGTLGGTMRMRVSGAALGQEPVSMISDTRTTLRLVP